MRWGTVTFILGIWAALAGTAYAGPFSPHASFAAAPTGPAPEQAVVTELLDGPVIGSGVFTLHEEGLPYLGFEENSPASVIIGIVSPAYQDQFTIYFPQGSASLTLPAEDMVAMAAEAVLLTGEAEIWVSAGPSLTDELGFARIDQVHDTLMENGIPGRWIRVDDGSLEQVLARPVTMDDGQGI